MLTRASFENFKALKQVDVDLSPLTMLVGKNSAGKTSVLQGIHSATLVGVRQRNDEEERPTGRLGVLFSGRRDPRRLMTQPGTGPMSISLTNQQGRTLKVEAALTTTDTEVGARQFTVSLSGHEPASISLPGDSPSVVKGLLGSPELRSFTSAVFLHLDAEVMIRPSTAESEQPRLEYDGEGLASVLNYFAGAEPALLEAVTQDLARIVPQVKGIRTYPAAVTRRRQERIVIGDQAVNRTFEEQVWGHRFTLDMGNNRHIPADLLSEGTVIALGILVALRHPQCPQLVLADDIDQALHPGAQIELVRSIRTILASRPEVQVVCTTHSPDLLDEVRLEEVRVMALDAEGHAVCKRLSEHPESQKWRNMLRTGEFWASVGEDWATEASSNGG